MTAETLGDNFFYVDGFEIWPGVLRPSLALASAEKSTRSTHLTSQHGPDDGAL